MTGHATRPGPQAARGLAPPVCPYGGPEAGPFRLLFTGSRTLARNAAMVATRPDYVLAVIRACEEPVRTGRPCRDRRGRAYPDGHGTHGSTHTVLLATEAGCEMTVRRERL